MKRNSDAENKFSSEVSAETEVPKEARLEELNENNFLQSENNKKKGAFALTLWCKNTRS